MRSPTTKRNRGLKTEMGIRSILGAAAFGIVAALASGAVSPAAAGPSFPSAVEKILMNQQTGQVSKLPLAKKRELIVCVNQVLAQLPNGKKRFVTEAASYDEMEDHFGKVVLENRAEWKQRIAQSCASIVV
jgi:hypothetical protein